MHSGSVPMAIGVHTDMATPRSPGSARTPCAASFSRPRFRRRGRVRRRVRTGRRLGRRRDQNAARSDGDDYVIDGGKMSITNGAEADLDVPARQHRRWSQTSQQVSDLRADENERRHVARKLDKLGMRASDTAQIFFEGVRVPKRNRIGDEGKGFVYQMMQFQEERLWAAAACLKAHEHTIAETIAYRGSAEAFGRSILDNQTVHSSSPNCRRRSSSCARWSIARPRR